MGAITPHIEAINHTMLRVAKAPRGHAGDHNGNTVAVFEHTRNTMAPRLPGAQPFQLTTRPTPLQTKVFELLGVKP